MAMRPVQIIFRKMRVAPGLEQEIRSRVEWLESFYPAVVGCRVLLEVPHRHRTRGRRVHVRIELSLPGEDLIVDHQPAVDVAARPATRKSDESDGRHKHALVAIHDAFDVARRRLEEAARRQRGDVKTLRRSTRRAVARPRRKSGTAGFRTQPRQADTTISR
jgi:hypothetical protein